MSIESVASIAFMGFASWLLPLLFTIVIEVPVALLFGLRARGALAVVLIDTITNPALNLIVLALYGFGIGFQTGGLGGANGMFSTQLTFYAIMLVLEAIVVVVEWRMLIWALRGTSLSSRRLLLTSLTMNAASCAAALIIFR